MPLPRGTPPASTPPSSSRPPVNSRLTTTWARPATALALALVTALSASAAPPTIGGATVSPADFTVAAVTGQYSFPTLVGSFFMFGADALEWDSYTFWRGLASNNNNVAMFQDMYRGLATAAGFPAYLTNSEIVTKLLVNLLDTQPDNAQVLYWTQQLNLCQISNANTAKGCVMAQMNNAILSDSSALAARARNRIAASQMIKYETDTATEQGSTTDRSVVLNASRARLQPITDAVATRDAAVATLPRLRWVIEQNGIAARATFNAASGELVVNGTDMLAQVGTGNDIDPSKLTLYGDDTAYTLTSGGVDLTSVSQFRITLNAADRQALLTRFNRDGAASKGNVAYLLTGAPGWNTAYSAAQAQAALTGTLVTVSNTALLNVDRSDTTAYDAATDGVLLLRYLLGLRGAALVDSARGTGTALRDAAAIEAHLAGALPVYDVDGDGQTLPHTDGLMILRRLLNPTAPTSDTSAMAAVTAGAKRGSRTDAQIVNVIDALKP